jgi:hypothetical protein
MWESPKKEKATDRNKRQGSSGRHHPIRCELSRSLPDFHLTPDRFSSNPGIAYITQEGHRLFLILGAGDVVWFWFRREILPYAGYYLINGDGITES